MPIYTPMPEDVGERRFAERLADLDDGKLHLWFDLTLPTVPTLDVVIWDETAGVFLVEVKSVPLALLLKFSDTDMEMRDAGWSRSPVQKARIASSRLVDYLREVGCPAIRVACTVAWPRITRSEWKERWSGESFPKDYELSMLFVDDVRGGIAGLRERLRWIAENPLWGATRSVGFRHNADVFHRFADALNTPVSAVPVDLQDTPTAATPADSTAEQADVKGALANMRRHAGGEYRSKLWLGTEVVTEAGDAALRVLQDAGHLMGEGWSACHCERIHAILDRLEQPFKLGVVGEFRAGKSSLINALIGREVAVVAEFECTFAPQRFYYSPSPEACVVYRDGHVERLEVDAVYSLLSNAYSSGRPLDIERTEVGLPAPILESLDLWDSPGLGGSDENKETASRFAETVDAALWVFDPGYAGQRGLSPTISALRQRGKTVVGVVNKCDYMTSDELDRVNTALRRSYPALAEAPLIPFSAALALQPDDGRDTSVGWAVDSRGNLDGVLDTIREVILSSPGRITARAAAGDLRAVVYAARDEVHACALEIKRRDHLWDTQIRNSEKLLEKELSAVGRELELGVMGALRSHFHELGQQLVASMPHEVLRDEQRAKDLLGAIHAEETMGDFIEKYLVGQRGWIEERLKGLLRTVASDYAETLTPLDVFDHASLAIPIDTPVQTDAPPPPDTSEQGGTEFSEEVYLDPKRGFYLGTATLTTLGTLALAIPGPQWMIVIPAGIIAGVLGGIRHVASYTYTDEELRKVLTNHWYAEVNKYLDGKEVKPALIKHIQAWCENVHVAMRAEIRRLLETQVFGSEGRTAAMERLAALSAMAGGLDMVIEQLGSPPLPSSP